MKVRIYGLKNCDSCRKAMKALPEADLIDVRAEGVPEDVLSAALETFGDALVNTRSTTWRGMSDEQRKGAPRDLLLGNPTLMKRPLIAVKDRFFLSWNSKIEAEIQALL